VGFGVSIKLLNIKNKLVTKDHKKPRTCTDSLDKRPKRKKADIRFRTWNLRNMYRAVAEEISIYKLDLVGVLEVTWDGGGTEPVGEHIFFCGKRNDSH
jgi:hypothetical protein